MADKAPREKMAINYTPLTHIINLKRLLTYKKREMLGIKCLLG